MRLVCVLATGYILFCLEVCSVLPLSDKILTATACYGNTHSSFVTLSCGESEVIVVRSVKAMAKRNATLCPDTQIATNEHLTQSRNCCIHEPLDCGGRYTGQVYKSYYQNCQGKRQCVGLQTSWVVTSEEFPHCNPAIYLARTNYMIYEYSCVSAQSIRSPCAGLQATGTSVYLWNAGYPTAMQPSGADSCNCSVEILCDSSIVVTAIDLRLQSSSNVCKQTITVSDSAQDRQIDCSMNNDFVTTTVMTSQSYLMTLQFKDEYQQTGGNFWIGISGGHPSAELSLKCGNSLTTELTDTQKPACGTDATTSTSIGGNSHTTNNPGSVPTDIDGSSSSSTSVATTEGTASVTGTSVATTDDSASVTTSGYSLSTTESTTLRTSNHTTTDSTGSKDNTGVHTTADTTNTGSKDLTGSSSTSTTSDTTTQNTVSITSSGQNTDITSGNSSFSTTIPSSVTFSSDSSASTDSSSTPTTASFTGTRSTTDSTGINTLTTSIPTAENTGDSLHSTTTDQTLISVTNTNGNKDSTRDSLHSTTTDQNLINVTNTNGNKDGAEDGSTTPQNLMNVTNTNGNKDGAEDGSTTTQNLMNVTNTNGNGGSQLSTGITTAPSAANVTNKNGNNGSAGAGGEGRRGSDGTGNNNSDASLKMDNSTEDNQSDNSLMVVIIAVAVVAVVIIVVILILFINRKKIRQTFCPSKVDEASIASDESPPPLYDSMPNPLFSVGALPVIPGTAAGSTQLQTLPGNGFVSRKPQLAPLYPPPIASPRPNDSQNHTTSLLFDGHLPPIGALPRPHAAKKEIKPESGAGMSTLPPIDTSTTPRLKPRLSLLSMIMDEHTLPKHEASAEDTSARRGQSRVDMEDEAIKEQKAEKKRRLRKKRKKLLERLHNVKHI